MNLPTRLAIALTLTVLLVVAASAQGASAAEPQPPTSPLDGTLAPDCIMVGSDTPAVRWSFINDTNGPHIFELLRNGEVAYSQVMSPGTSVTHTLVDHQKAWQGTHQTVEVVAMGKTRAHLHHYFDCRPAELEVVDIDLSLTNHCTGSAKLELANTGGHTTEATVAVDGVPADHATIHGNESLTSVVSIEGGQELEVLQDGEVVHLSVVPGCGDQPAPEPDPPIQDPPVQDPPDQDPPELAAPVDTTASSSPSAAADPLPWFAAAALTVLIGATAAVAVRHR